MDLEEASFDEILKLLVACDELCIEELIESLQKVLINKVEEQTEQNLTTIYDLLLNPNDFKLLQGFWTVKEFEKSPTNDIHFDSLLNAQSRDLLRSWIDPNFPLSNAFSLIFSSNNTKSNLFSAWKNNEFYDKKKFLLVMKIQETGELIGGYSSVGWQDKTNETNFLASSENFIFKLNPTQLKKSVLSSIKQTKLAMGNVKCDRDYYLSASGSDKFSKIGRMLVSFYELVLYVVEEENVPYGSYYYNISSSYKNDLNLDVTVNKDASFSLCFLLESFEIYELVNIDFSNSSKI